MTIFNPFKANKALKQAKRYVDDVNKINQEYQEILVRQRKMITMQTATIKEQNATIRTLMGMKEETI